MRFLLTVVCYFLMDGFWSGHHLSSVSLVQGGGRKLSQLRTEKVKCVSGTSLRLKRPIYSSLTTNHVYLYFTYVCVQVQVYFCILYLTNAVFLFLRCFNVFFPAVPDNHWLPFSFVRHENWLSDTWNCVRECAIPHTEHQVCMNVCQY